MPVANPRVLKGAMKAGSKAGLSTAERTRLGRAWGLAVGAKNPDLLQTAGFLYGRDAAARFKSLGPDQTVAFMTPDELRALSDNTVQTGEPGALDPVQIQGTLGPDGGLVVKSVSGLNGLDVFATHAGDRKIPVIVPKSGMRTPQYLSYNGKRVNGIRTKLAPERLDEMYKNQQGRSVDVLRWMMDPANADQVAIGYAHDGDVWGDLQSKLDVNEQVGLQEYFGKNERRFNMSEMVGIRKRQLNQLYEEYRKIRTSMGEEAFNKLRGTSAITPGSLYGDTSEFADMPFLTTRVDSHKVGLPAGARDNIPAWDFSRETGLHSGTLDTEGRFIVRYDRDRYDEAQAILKDPSVDKETKAINEKFVTAYEKNVTKAKTALDSTIKNAIKGASQEDVSQFTGLIDRFTKKYADSPPEFTTVEWFNSVTGRQQLESLLKNDLKIPDEAVGDLVSSLVDYYHLTAKSTTEVRRYLTTGVNNPLLIHDMSGNKPDRIAEYLLGIPEFQQYGKELDEIIQSSSPDPLVPRAKRPTDRAARTKMNQEQNAKIYDILKRRGYDSIAYMNQGETVNAGAGILEPSFILPPKSPVSNLSDIAPKYAREQNLKSVAALLGPITAAIAASRSNKDVD